MNRHTVGDIVDAWEELIWDGLYELLRAFKEEGHSRKDRALALGKLNQILLTASEEFQAYTADACMKNGQADLELILACRQENQKTVDHIHKRMKKVNMPQEPPQPPPGDSIRKN